MIPKGYKHTELGILPEDWEVVRLGEVCDVRDGTHESPKPTNKGKILVTSKNLKGGKIDFSDSYYISLEDFEAINKRSKVEKHDILMSMIGTVGEIAFVDIEPNFAIKNVALFKMSGNEKFSKFLFFFFQSPISKKRILSFLSGSTQKYITLDFLRNLQIPLPPLAEQEKIAEILSTWDTQIQNYESLITEKQTLKKGLCQTLLTAKTRLKGFSGDWEVVRLGDVAKIYQPQTIKQTDFSLEGYLVYGANGVIGKYHSFNHEKEQIAIACRGNTCGSVHFTEPFSWITGNAMVVNLDDSKKINKAYAYQKLSVDNFNYLITGSGQPQITSDIKNHKIPIPSLAEQEKIAEILGEGDKEIMLLEQKLESLKSQKKGLIQKLLNGKVRVKI